MSESMILDALLRDIRAKCLDCMGGSRTAVAACDCTGCSLHRHRMSRRERETLVVAPGADRPVGVQMDMMAMAKSKSA